jgi:hypothetical protein
MHFLRIEERGTTGIMGAARAPMSQGRVRTLVVAAGGFGRLAGTARRPPVLQRIHA